jgi:uncharacterized protein (DUF1778 family)
MRDKAILIKVTAEEQALIQEQAKVLGFSNTSDFLRYVGIHTKEIHRGASKGN